MEREGELDRVGVLVLDHVTRQKSLVQGVKGMDQAHGS